MKKSNIILLILLSYGIITFIIPEVLPNSILSPINTEAGFVLINSIIYLGLFIIAIYFRLDESYLNTKELTFIIIYSTLTSLVRIPFAGIPNFQPCSYLIICAGIVFGPLIGFIIGGNVALISNIFLGHGPWTIYQIFAWGCMGASSGLIFSKYRENNFNLDKAYNLSSINNPNLPDKSNVINKIYKVPSNISICIFGFLWGFLFGWIMNIWYWIRYIEVHTLTSFILLNLTNIAFDFSHALSNFLFLYFFGLPTLRILQRFKIRFKIIIR